MSREWIESSVVVAVRFHWSVLTLTTMAAWSLLRSTFLCTMSSQNMDQTFMVNRLHLLVIDTLQALFVSRSLKLYVLIHRCGGLYTLCCTWL